MNIVLANVDYQKHMTDEGDQLQLGFQFAGWRLTGMGYGDDCKNVPMLLERYSPECVFVHDKRDWDAASGICFRKDLTFEQLGVLKDRPDIFRCCVVKDAGSSIPYQRAFCEEIGANAVVVYYHEQAVSTVSRWLTKYPLIRTYHSVDADFAAKLNLRQARQRCLVSGALSMTYPLRMAVFQNAAYLRTDVLKHPRYGNNGSATPSYLQTLCHYKVHVATASNYNFALRKIIESVACGATPVTNLPEWDRLPEIDEALIRIPSRASMLQVRTAIDQAESNWNLDRALMLAAKARCFYDWKAMGIRLSGLIMGMAGKGPRGS